MSFPFVVVNTLLLFAVAAAVSCWGFALIPIWRARMATITCVPFVAGLVAAVWLWARGSGWIEIVLLASVTALLANMFLAFVYGWARKRQFDAADVEAGIGRFGPVMVLWTCSLFFVAIVTIVNTSLTGSPIPFRHALGAG